MATVNARRSPTRLKNAFGDDNNTSSATANGRHAEGQMRQRLQALLDEKERQLQQAEALSQRVLAQQMELEERINQIAELDENGDPSSEDGEGEIRTQLDELAQTMHGWATENETLWAGAVTKDAPSDSSGIPQYESDAQPTANTPSAAQSSRRAKNAAHRANDVEFAFEIGSGLLTEIRRLQSLLAERDKTLQDMKDERDDMDRSIENLRTALRTQETNADKYKEENWNLEVTLQEIRSQLTNTQSSLERSEAEQRRTQKQMTTLREASEAHKTESERLTNQLTDLKSKHETDVAQMRKQAATLQREKGELQTNVENLKAEAAKKTKTIGKFGSPMTPNDSRYLTPARATEYGDEEDEDVFGTVGSTRRRMDSSLVFGDGYDLDLDALSPDVSPIKNAAANKSPGIPNHAASELEALKQSLAHAHRQIGTLKTSLARERQLRSEYGRKLEGHGDKVASVEGMDEGDDEDFEDEPGELPRVTPLRAGRGGARGGRTTRPTARTSLAAKLAKAAKAGQTAPQFETIHDLPVADFSMNDQEEWVDVDEQTGARRSEDRQSVDLDEDARRRSIDDLGRQQKTQSMLSVASSMDGMDPVFANVLKGSSHRDSHRTSSELGRTSIDSARTIEKGKKPPRKALNESRPGSVFEAPGTLASELGGLADASAVADDDRLRAELGLGDEEDIEEDVEGDFDEEDVLSTSHASVARKDAHAETTVTPLPVVEAKPKVQTEDMGIQCDLLLPPPPPPVIERSVIAIQTDDIPAPILPATESFGTQTESPVLEDAAVATDPQPKRQYANSAVGTIEPVQDSTVKRVPIEMVGAAAGGAVTGAGVRSSIISEKRASKTIPPSAFNAPPSAFKDPAQRSVSRADTVSDGDTEYEDARETATTPTQSLGDDYQSINDSDHSDDGTETDSAESIKVSLMHIKRPGAGPGAGTSMKVPIRNVSATEEEEEEEEEEEPSDKRDTMKPEQVVKIVEVEKPKPEVKEVSIQTDDWKPSLPAGTQLFALGPQAQQFQFVTGPTSPGTSPIAPPTGVPGLKQGVQARSPIVTSPSSGSISDLARPRVPSGTLNVPSSPKAVDRTKPPTMMLPPPPRLPPPPTSPTLVSGSSILKPGPPNMGPPPRPISPPPPELIQRATTPTMSRNSTLLVPGRTISQSRSSSSAVASPTPVQGRQVRPAVNGMSQAAAGNEPNVLQDPFDEGVSQNIGKSMASLASGRRSISSRRLSIASSVSSEHAGRMNDAPKSMTQISAAPSEVARRAGDNSATDPLIIHAITQTMIGEYLYKYTRKPIGKKHAERRHRRYFWIHPYTKTIYWSAVDPGSSNVQESSAKSAYIESVKSVMDPNPMPPGLHQYSVIVTTANREMKFTAPTKERHDIWFNALNYLLSRPSPNQPALNTVDTQPPSNLQQQMTQPNEEVQRMQYSPRSQRSGQSAVTVDSYSAVQPRPPRSISRMSNPYGSVSKRGGTAAAEFMRWNDAPASPSKVEDRIPDGDFHVHDDTDAAYDGLENVRACCDGKHEVGSRHHHHHHQQHSQQPSAQPSRSNMRAATDAIPDRPGSPSGWSFRSSRRV
ncbi:hypothetical protein FRC15_003911 [Serendipita sp. 397]|nr:hypothetical protein FRC15_003911 [Serendipita sp. 397]